MVKAADADNDDKHHLRNTTSCEWVDVMSHLLRCYWLTSRRRRCAVCTSRRRSYT